MDLTPVPKQVPPESDQLPNESRKFWAPVTEANLNKDYSKAKMLKQALEDRQRKKATERNSANEEWTPRFFTGALTPVGRPDLTKEGLDALQGLHEGNYKLKPSEKLGA